MGGEVIEITDETFDEIVLNADVPTIVDFWAEWCAPCKAIAPIVRDLAVEYAGRLKVGKLNVDENPKTASRFSIRGIPTLLIFKNGEVQEQIVGVQPKGVIKESLDRVIG
jgi:thioredoxin 1